MTNLPIKTPSPSLRMSIDAKLDRFSKIVAAYTFEILQELVDYNKGEQDMKFTRREINSFLDGLEQEEKRIFAKKGKK